MTTQMIDPKSKVTVLLIELDRLRRVESAAHALRVYRRRLLPADPVAEQRILKSLWDALDRPRV